MYWQVAKPLQAACKLHCWFIMFRTQFWMVPSQPKCLVEECGICSSAGNFRLTRHNRRQKTRNGRCVLKRIQARQLHARPSLRKPRLLAGVGILQFKSWIFQYLVSSEPVYGSFRTVFAHCEVSSISAEDFEMRTTPRSSFESFWMLRNEWHECILFWIVNILAQFQLRSFFQWWARPLMRDRSGCRMSSWMLKFLRIPWPSLNPRMLSRWSRS